MPTSYPAYSATILPDDRLRALVFVSGIVLGAAGACATACLAVAPQWRLAIASAWIALTLSALLRLRRRSLAVTAYRVYPDGSLDLQLRDGMRAGRLLPGSVLYERVGWLRVASSDGAAWAELVTGNCRKNKGWRRLQVIFRHRSA